MSEKSPPSGATDDRAAADPRIPHENGTDDRRAAGGETLSMSRDDAYHLLQSKRRRAVLRFLLSHDDQDRFVMRDVAEIVAAWEHGTTVERLSSTERQRVYIALYQSHLPKLDEHGVVDYDQSRGLITVRPLARVLEPVLDVEAGLDAPETVGVADVETGSADGEPTSGSLLSRLGFPP